MKHPKSTVFNIFYLFGGLITLIFAVREPNVMQAVASLIFIGLAIASTGYHWTETRKWRHADIIAIYATFFVAMAFQLSQIQGFENYKVLLLIVFLGLSAAMAFTYHDWSHTQIGVLGILNLLFLYPRAGFWVTIGTAVLFIGGLYIGQVAETHPKDSNQYDTLHALWKVPTAAGITILLLTF